MFQDLYIIKYRFWHAGCKRKLFCKCINNWF